MGGPTVRLLRMVESMETKPQRTAVSKLISGPIIRSRIGLPYLLSPICKKGVSLDVVM